LGRETITVNCRFATSLIFLLTLSSLIISGVASATTASFNFSGFTVPDDDSGIEPDVSATFTWNDACTVGCTLELGLQYNDVGGLVSPAHILAGVTWDVVGAMNVDPSISIVLAPTLVGGSAATAISDLPGPTTIGSVTGAEVTGHWAYRDDLVNGSDPTVPVEWDSLGDFVLSSVGDIQFAGIQSDQTGFDHLLPGVISSVELNPTNGQPFAIVDPNTTSVSGVQGNIVFAQGSITAFLRYDGQLSDIDNVTPLFSTNGVAIIPEPSTALLLGMGLAGLGAVRRRRPIHS
jgi:hypothetical protein